VHRLGLEAVLVVAAVTASFVGARSSLRRPVAAGAGAALAASVVTWFLAIAVIGALGGPGLDVQAATGLLAVVVLLVVMNWFFHRLYWTGWIQHHNKRRRALLSDGGRLGVTAGFVLLGFTAVYREGFELVIFLQNLRITQGSGVVLEGVAIGLAMTAAVGVLTFAAQHRLPYRRMLVFTGVLLGFVLIVMVGESAQELQLAGWIPTTPIGVAFPGFLGLWFAVFPTVETLTAQLLAALLVLGSYFVAEEMKVRGPKRRGEQPAAPADAPEPLPADA
jgi:high-affinity iron transporter